MAHDGLMNVDLAEQLASLRKEFGALKKAVAGRSSDFYEIRRWRPSLHVALPSPS
jgi:hypothetical protein